jgi:unsaturated rhamnogalacturonyl hydrolase
MGGEVHNRCDKANYLESSASSMFTYAYLKGIRLGVLDKRIYLPLAEKAYSGLLRNFIREENGEVSIIHSCASAGLGPAKDKSRTGTVNYYLCGKDVTITQNEGKAIGPFILASLEFERRK